MVLELVFGLLVTFEACHAKKPDGLIYPYTCPAGYATQGYGIRVKSLNEPPITCEEAERRAKEIIPIYMWEAIRASPKLLLYPKKLAAITDFIYNLGPAAYKASTLKKRVDAEDWEAASKEALRWNKGRDKKTGKLVVMGGLTKRCAVRAQLLLS